MTPHARARETCGLCGKSGLRGFTIRSCSEHINETRARELDVIAVALRRADAELVKHFNDAVAAANRRAKKKKGGRRQIG